MDEASLRLILGAIADQQYRFHTLVKLLINKKIISSEEFHAMYSEKEKAHFSHDLLESLVATGLRISEGLPSSCPKESASSSELKGKATADPELGKNS